MVLAVVCGTSWSRDTYGRQSPTEQLLPSRAHDERMIVGICAEDLGVSRPFHTPSNSSNTSGAASNSAEGPCRTILPFSITTA